MKLKNVEDVYSLSPLQQGVLFHTLSAPDSGVYFEQITWTMRGGLDVAAFERAWRHAAGLHPALRTAFFWEGLDEPLQVVRRQVKLPLAQHDWRGMPPGLRRDSLDAYLADDRRRGFNPAAAPLMRLALIRLEDDFYQFVWSYHHILLDGWSISVVLGDVLAAYEAASRGEPPRKARGLPYRAYIEWLKRQDLASAEAYWRAALAGFDAPTPLNIDRPREAAATATGYAVRRRRLPEDLTADLQNLARAHRLTLNTLVQGAWALLLSRYGGEERVAFGTVVSGRPPELHGAAGAVGLFINTVAVCVRTPDGAPLLEWLKEFQGQQAELRQYEYSPLVQVQGWSEVARGLPLFESIVVFQNHPVSSALPNRGGGGPELADVNYVHTGAGYPVMLVAEPGPRLELKLTFDAARFGAAAVERMLGHLEQLLRGMTADPAQTLGRLELLNGAERAGLARHGDGTAAEYQRDKCIHELFEEQAARTPDSTAVTFGDESLTFAELNARANQLARHLRSRGVGPEARVGVCLGRSAGMVVALLGVLKAGGAYVPLDPEYPADRLAFMLEDAAVKVLVTEERARGRVHGYAGQVISLDGDREEIRAQETENVVGGAVPENAAYVIYTSGSTGRPKGVLGLHRGTVNRFCWMWKRYPFAAGEVCCQKTSISFVDSVWEIFGPLARGVRVVVVPAEEVGDVTRFIRTLAAKGVTRLVLVPSLLRVMLDAGEDLRVRLPRLRLWVSSGEALPPELAESFRRQVPQGTLLNLYGSSEVSADSTCFDASAHAPHDAVAIGRPIANTRVYVLDRALRLAPAGVPGELYIAGEGLARGYLNRPGLTAERFVPNPFSRRGGELMYRTGDLARLLPDGQVEYLGRADYQVKVRGMRVELGEVEAALRAHPSVRAAVVSARGAGGEGRLVAYLVASPTPAVGVLREFLVERLPEHMIPATFMTLAALPLTPSGKVDRRALPEPSEAEGSPPGSCVEPETPTEVELAAIWSEVFGGRRVGAADNFFDLGGHSLMLTQVASRVRTRFGVELPMRELLSSPTVRALAAKVEEFIIMNTSAADIDEMLDLLESAEASQAQETPGS